MTHELIEIAKGKTAAKGALLYETAVNIYEGLLGARHHDWYMLTGCGGVVIVPLGRSGIWRLKKFKVTRSHGHTVTGLGSKPGCLSA